MDSIIEKWEEEMKSLGPIVEKYIEPSRQWLIANKELSELDLMLKSEDLNDEEQRALKINMNIKRAEVIEKLLLMMELFLSPLFEIRDIENAPCEFYESQFDSYSKIIGSHASLLSELSRGMQSDKARREAVGQFFNGMVHSIQRKPGQKPGEKFVYFARCKKGRIKIGVSKHPKKRIRNLEDLEFRTIKLLGVMRAGFDFTSAFSLEKHLHKKFSKTNYWREWFFESPELSDFIKVNARSIESIRSEIEAEMEEEKRLGVCLYPPSRSSKRHEATTEAA